LKTQSKDPKKLIGIAIAIPAKKARFAVNKFSPKIIKTNFPKLTFASKAREYTIIHRNKCFLIEYPLAEKVKFLLIEKLKTIDIAAEDTLEKIKEVQI
jgi:hypothetical protein